REPSRRSSRAEGAQSPCICRATRRRSSRRWRPSCRAAPAPRDAGDAMNLGFVGLGKMGGNMVRRLLADRHEVVAWARGEDSVKEAVSYGGVGGTSLEDIVPRLSPPRVVWLMIPAGDPVESSIAALRPL